MNCPELYGKYDQGLFNATGKLVQEMAERNYLHFLVELDATGMDQVRSAARQEGDSAPTYTAFVIQAAARALREHPHLNCMIQELPWQTRLVRLPNVTATVAVERMVDGVDMVFAPMVHDPDRKPLCEVTDDLRYFAGTEVLEVREFRQLCALVKVARWLPALVGWLLRLPSLSPGLWR